MKLGKMNKKGIELPLSAIITIILMVIILSGGLVLTFRFFAGAEEISAEIDRSTKEQITSLLRTGNTIVSIPFNKAKLSRGEQKVFAVGIRNVGEKGAFSIKVEFDAAYDLNEKQISGISQEFVEDRWLGGFSTIANIHIEKNKIEVVPVLIKTNDISPQASAPHGIYVFNVCVYKDTIPPLAPCQPEQPLDAFYAKRMHQIFIEL